MAPPPLTPDAALAGKLLAELATLVRDLDPAELTLRATGAAELPVRLTVRHTAAFSVATAAGKGPLPATVEHLSSGAGLQAKLDRWLETAQQQGGGLVDQWADEEAGEYRAVLPPERCLAYRPVAGVEEVCAACQGQKRLKCPACDGAKQVTCQPCQGQGRTRCLHCDGGWKTCSSCHGQGYIEKTELELNPMDRQNTMNQQRQLTRQVPCPANCTNGRQRCEACDQGLVTCQGCNGMRIVNCRRCSAHGTVGCDDCAATGFVHHTGWIHCEVTRDTRVKVDSANPEDQHTLRERTPFDEIGRLATDSGGIWANRGVLIDQRQRDGLELTSWYSATVRLECIEATAGGERVTIRAYGPRREIYCYHNLIGRLLLADLADLEKALLDHSLFTPRPGSSLAPFMKRFLASEVHGKIAQAPATLAPLVTAGLLGPEHIQRAQAAMSKSAPRLYGPLVLPMALWGTAGLTAIFWVVRTHFCDWSPNKKFYSLLALTAIAWVAAEYRAQSELKTILSAPVYERLKAQFNKARNPYRLLPAAGFFFAWYITFFIFQLILHFGYDYPVIRP